MATDDEPNTSPLDPLAPVPEQAPEPEPKPEALKLDFPSDAILADINTGTEPGHDHKLPDDFVPSALPEDTNQAVRNAQMLGSIPGFDEAKAAGKTKEFLSVLTMGKLKELQSERPLVSGDASAGASDDPGYAAAQAERKDQQGFDDAKVTGWLTKALADKEKPADDSTPQTVAGYSRGREEGLEEGRALGAAQHYQRGFSEGRIAAQQEAQKAAETAGMRRWALELAMAKDAANPIPLAESIVDYVTNGIAK